jgi:hypothetical protein
VSVTLLISSKPERVGAITQRAALSSDKHCRIVAAPLRATRQSLSPAFCRSSVSWKVWLLISQVW